ncbi:MAG: type IV pilus assembly protein PilM, partial [Magnetococcales bacterium]|nr:type IV pilus assembly protein PilM [Magnetococcales bacterium]
RFADCEPLPPQCIVDGQIKQPERLLQALQALLARHPQHSKTAAFSLSGPAVITKKIQLAALSELELEDQIALEAEEYIPFEIQDVNLDFHILNRQNDSMEILLIACKRELLESHADIIRQAGLQPQVCDLDLLCLINGWQTFIRPNEPTPANSATLLVNLGTTLLNIAVVSANGQPGYIRDHALGSRQLLQELKTRYDYSHEQAEQWLIMAESAPQHQADSAWQTEILPPFLEHLLQQVRQAIQFHKASAPEQTVGNLVLSGGCARLPLLRSLMAERLPIPVSLPNPFVNLTDHTRSGKLPCAPERFLVALGLALRGEQS